MFDRSSASISARRFCLETQDWLGKQYGTVHCIGETGLVGETYGTVHCTYVVRRRVGRFAYEDSVDCAARLRLVASACGATLGVRHFGVGWLRKRVAAEAAVRRFNARQRKPFRFALIAAPLGSVDCRVQRHNMRESPAVATCRSCSTFVAVHIASRWRCSSRSCCESD